MRRHLPWLTLAFVACSLGAAAYLDSQHRGWLHRLNREDGPTEWLTVIVLLATLGYSLRVVAHAARSRRPGAALVWASIAAAALFGAGEELSWGQRLLDLNPTGWLRAHNRQGETNLHNLVVHGVSINKLVFSYVLGVAAVVYFAVMPALWLLSSRVRDLLGRWRIPVARSYQTAALLAVFVVVSLMGSSRKWEICEALACLCCSLSVFDPRWGSPLSGLTRSVEVGAPGVTDVAARG